MIQMRTIPMINYTYTPDQVRNIPEGQSSLTMFERHVLDLMDEGYSFDEAVDMVL